MINAINQGKDWLDKVEEMRRNESYPYYHTLDALIKKGSTIPINLIEKESLSKDLNKAMEWKDVTAKMFLNSNWMLGLLEALSPRTDILTGTRKNASNTQGKHSTGYMYSVINTPMANFIHGNPSAEMDNFMKIFSEDRCPTLIVAAIKAAEETELSNMRELRLVFKVQLLNSCIKQCLINLFVIIQSTKSS